MLTSQILIKLPWLLLLTLIIYFGSIYHAYEENFIPQSWNYYIHHQQFQHLHTQPHVSALKLQHDGEGHYEPLNLQITTKDNQVKTLLIDDLNHTHIDQQLQLQKHQIKHAIIKSSHPLNFNKAEKVRLLQDITQQDDFVLVSVKFFSFILPLIRNLLIVGVLFNQVDFFLPLIMMTESILMLAFLDNEKHYLTDLYKIIFNSNLDILNFIRTKIFAVNQTSIINGNPLMSQYGFGQNILHNLSGELTLIFGFLLLTVFVKAGAALLKIEKLRSAGSKMRGIWNGIVFCFLPRVLTFSSFSIREISFESFQETVHPMIGVLFVVGYLIFLAQLWYQIRRINERIQYWQESRNQIGLVSRIQYKRKFQFDCLSCSNLYYPIINFLRLLVFFLPIGASYDFTYGSFGGVIVSQMIYIMFSVSSSGFIKARDSLVYPFCDFLLMVLQLTHIAIGLAQNVKHTEVTIIAEKVFFSILLVIYLQLIGSICADISTKVKQFCIKNGDTDLKNQQKDLKTTKFKRTIKRKVTQSQQETKSTCQTTWKTEKKGPIFDDDSIQDDQSQKDSPFNYQRALTHVRPKIRKVRQGKII